MRTAPFQALPFSSLPERPRVPHDWERAADRFVDVPTLSLGEVRTRYRRFAARTPAKGAPPMLLIHGLMTTGYSYRYVAHRLAETRDVYVPDLPGAGRSTARAGVAYTPEAIIEWLGGFIDALDIRGCDCVGNSMGGMLTMRHVIGDPSAYRRLFSIHPPTNADLRLRALAGLNRAPGLQHIIAALPRVSPLRWVHKNVHYNDESLKSLEEAREYAEPLEHREGRHAFASHLVDLMSARGLDDFQAELRPYQRGADFPVPLVMLYADVDPMVPPAHGHHLQKLLPKVPFIWMKDTSHFAHVDTPEPVIDEIERFFA